MEFRQERRIQQSVLAGAAAAYVVTRWAPAGLWLASTCLVLDWFGDGLDGTVARVRNQQRPPLRLLRRRHSAAAGGSTGWKPCPGRRTSTCRRVRCARTRRSERQGVQIFGFASPASASVSVLSRRTNAAGSSS